MFNKFLTWFADYRARMNMSPEDIYLANSVDLIDLEQRQIRLRRGDVRFV